MLTDRGHAFLESDDPEVLMDWLVTRILGIDHALVILRDETRCSWQELVRRIQEVSPGWTSTRVPRAIIRELQELDMLELDDSKFFSLSDVGKEWAQRLCGSRDSRRGRTCRCHRCAAPTGRRLWPRSEALGF